VQNVVQSSPRVAYVPLHEASPVLLHRNACVQLRSRYADCRNCESICPTGALGIADGAMSVGPGCVGCGRCVAACPTGALQVRGFFSSSNLKGKGRVRVDCARSVQAAEARVPCLGGLCVSALLALRAAAGERELALIDHGWCGDCPAGKGAKEHPAAKSLARVQARLRDAGLPERLLPRLEAAPLPAPKRSEKPLIANPSRRSLVTGLRRALQAEPQAGRLAPAPAPERERVLAALARLAARYGGRVSEKLFNTIEVDPDACQAHGVCAAGCPTGALRMTAAADEAHRTLSHATALCIGCGHCERVCPEQAVRLVYGGGDVGVERRVVARFESRECECCGARITQSAMKGENRTVCERCAKRGQLARAAFQQFHGSRAADGI
jgi:ferredoxin